MYATKEEVSFKVIISCINLRDSAIRDNHIIHCY